MRCFRESHQAVQPWSCAKEPQQRSILQCDGHSQDPSLRDAMALARKQVEPLLIRRARLSLRRIGRCVAQVLEPVLAVICWNKAVRCSVSAWFAAVDHRCQPRDPSRCAGSHRAGSFDTARAQHHRRAHRQRNAGLPAVPTDLQPPVAAVFRATSSPVPPSAVLQSLGWRRRSSARDTTDSHPAPDRRPWPNRQLVPHPAPAPLVDSSAPMHRTPGCDQPGSSATRSGSCGSEATAAPPCHRAQSPPAPASARPAWFACAAPARCCRSD